MGKSAHRRVIVVSGAIANKHLNGGEAWARLNWVLGLRRLGFSVCFVEQMSRQACVDDAGAPAPFEESANLEYFRRVMTAFGLERCASLVCDEGGQVWGRAYDDVLSSAETAEVLINISGHLTPGPIFDRIRRKAYIDLDPGFTQFWQAQGVPGARLEGHDVYFTVGENIGRGECPIPTGGIAWLPKTRFVVLDQWPVCSSENPARFTTVGAWRGPFGPVEHAGQTYGLKVHEFRKVMTLPLLARQAFELALSIHAADHADLAMLRQHRWQVVQPREVAADPLAYRRYVQGSGGEFSAAQGMYVGTQCGWLSDRTVRYLASGKPALVQDTGFSTNYPVGEGLVTYRTLDEAVAGAESIAADYPGHARAARRLAETHFDSDIVLRRMLEQMGVPVGSRP